MMVTIPNGGINYQVKGLMDVLWKFFDTIINGRIQQYITIHESIYIFILDGDRNSNHIEKY